MNRASSNLAVLAVLFALAAPAQSQGWSVQSLTQARRVPAPVSVGDRVFFAGGDVAGTMSAAIDVYDDATGTWSTDSLPVARAWIGAAALGPVAFFAGGLLNNSSETGKVDVFDTLTTSWSTAILSQARFGIGATAVGSKLIFAGGITGGMTNPVASNVVDIYDSTLGPPTFSGAWSTTTLSKARGLVAAVTVGDLAIFAGGGNPAGPLSDVDIYDASTGLWSVASLSLARVVGPMGTATIGDRAYFVGGEILGPAMSDRVDVYDASTGLWSTDSISAARAGVGVVALGNTLICAGGLGTGYVPMAVVDILDVGTGQWSLGGPLSAARTDLARATVGGKALFAGGSSGFGSPHADVDFYEPVGSTECLALSNSSGCAATIAAIGSASLAANDLVLTTTCVPNQVFLYLHGTTQLQLPFGDGFRCVGGGVKRIAPAALAAGGVAQRAVDLPTAGITIPGVRRFQCWFRDPAAGGAGFNTSNALVVEFVP